jgi:hypothetical protein
MEWCLGCHRKPEDHLRPKAAVFDMNWVPPKDQLSQGRKLIAERHIPVERLTDCYTCHR